MADEEQVESIDEVQARLRLLAEMGAMEERLIALEEAQAAQAADNDQLAEYTRLFEYNDNETKERFLTLNAACDVLDIRRDGNVTNLEGFSLRKRPFDLRNFTTLRFSLWDYAAQKGAIRIHGVTITSVTINSPWSYDTDHWDYGADLTGESVVYLELNRPSATAELKVAQAATLPNGSQNTRNFPLYYIGWNGTSGIIDFSKIYDMRESFEIGGMA